MSSTLRVVSGDNGSKTSPRREASESIGSQDDISEYIVDQPSPTSSPERTSAKVRCGERLGGDMKRLKIELPPSVIRSYLDDGTMPLEELRDMNSLVALTDKAEVIVRLCKASPLQAFYYCMDYPEGDPKAFLDLKRRVNLAFHLEGMRIMHLLSEEDRSKLIDTPLEDVLTEFRNRDAHLLILSALKERVDESIAMDMMQDSACQSRMSIGGEERALAEKLLYFWNERQDLTLRQDRLRLAFAEYGMQLRDTCSFCNAYIEGKVDADVEDVIGISVIGSRLRGRRKETARYLPACEEELRKGIHHKSIPLKEAVHEAMRTIKRTDKIPAPDKPTLASLLAYATKPSNYLPFSVMILRKEICSHDS